MTSRRIYDKNKNSSVDDVGNEMDSSLDNE